MVREAPLATGHAQLENRFKQICNEHGFRYIDLSYHHILPDKDVTTLQREMTPCSLAVRTSPDFIVMTGNGSVFFELKTGSSRNRITLEAYPLMCNQIKEAELCCPCIYIYSGACSNYEPICCHAKDIHPDQLVLPEVDKNRYIKRTLLSYYDCECVSKKIPSYFSGDAHVVVTKQRLSNWIPLDDMLRQQKK